MSDEPPTSEEANEVIEVKAEEAPTSDALSFMPGRVSQLIADYAFNLEEKFLNTYIVPGFYEPEHFDEMEGWDSKKVQAFKDYLEKRHDGARELVEEALRDFEYGEEGEEGEGYESDEAGEADEGEAKAEEGEEVHEAKEAAGPGLSPVRVHVPEEANGVVEVKAEESPTSSDALSYMPGHVSQLIADYARVETH